MEDDELDPHFDVDDIEWSPEGLERLMAAIADHPTRAVIERSQGRSADPGRFRPMWF